MSEHNQPSRADVGSTEINEQPQPTEHVERSDVGVSLTVKLKRGTGTRDQDEVIAKAKGKTLEDAREDMETLRACVAYENTNQQRVQILRRLEHRASEIRSQKD